MARLQSLYNDMQPLTDALDFVILDFQLHEEFDEFKRDQIECGYLSYLKVNELLQFFIDSHLQVTDSIVTQYDQTYLKMTGDDVDKLCK